MKMRIVALLFYTTIFFLSFPSQAMEEQKEAAPRSGFDLLLINTSPNHRAKLDLNRSVSAHPIPSLEFKDYDSNVRFVKKIYEHSPTGEGKIILSPNEACLLTNITNQDTITWLGTAVNSKLNIKKAISNETHVFRFVNYSINRSNLHYEYIRTLIGDEQNWRSASQNDSTNLYNSRLDPHWKIKNTSKRFPDCAFELHKQDGVKALFTYTPQQRDEHAKPILLVVVHGTWAHQSAAFYDVTSEDFTNILRFSQQLAEEHKTGIEVLSFGWAGKNDFADRITGGDKLAEILMKFYSSDHSIITLAHSHGCNVVNNASRKIRDLPINLMIHLATPVRDESEISFKPDHFEVITQFYSTSDLVGAAGALSTENIFSSAGSIRKYTQQKHGDIYNIRTQIDGADTGHSALTAIVPYLFKIIKTISNCYIYNNDLDLNINTNEDSPHTVTISIRHELAGEAFFNLPEMKNLSDQNALPILRFLRIFRNELLFSTEQEKEYTQMYDKNIHTKKYLAQRLLSGAFAEIASAFPQFSLS